MNAIGDRIAHILVEADKVCPEEGAALSALMTAAASLCATREEFYAVAERISGLLCNKWWFERPALGKD